MSLTSQTSFGMGGDVGRRSLIMIHGESSLPGAQSIGRGVRKAKDKDFVQIWDLTSTCKFAKRHLTQRKKFYKEAEYPFSIEKVEWN